MSLTLVTSQFAQPSLGDATIELRIGGREATSQLVRERRNWLTVDPMKIPGFPLSSTPAPPISPPQ